MQRIYKCSKQRPSFRISLCAAVEKSIFESIAVEKNFWTSNLQSLEVLLQHPEDNRNQIRELAQTLMDGGVLDELIQQKLDAFNTRWDELMARVR